MRTDGYLPAQAVRDMTQTRLAEAIQQCPQEVILRWEWSLSPGIATVWHRENRTELTVDLGWLMTLQKEGRFGGGFSLRWGVEYLAEHIALLAGEDEAAPGSYLRGLALWQTGCDRAEGIRRRILMPVYPGSEIRGRGSFSPGDLWCLVTGAENARRSLIKPLTAQQENNIQALQLRLSLLGQFPETDYPGNFPRNALQRTMERTKNLRLVYPHRVERLAPYTVSCRECFLRYNQGEGDFWAGLGLRKAIFDEDQSLEDSEAIRGLVAAAEAYRAGSFRFCRELDLHGDVLAADAFGVIRKTLTGLRKLEDRYGLTFQAPGVHVIEV